MKGKSKKTRKITSKYLKEHTWFYERQGKYQQYIKNVT